MSTKTAYTQNPTANLFELLQVDSDLPEKRTPSNKSQAGKKPADVPLETPAEKGQRRKAAEAQKAAAAAAEKQKKDAEEAMAALIPQEGFQVQKGSQQKKPVDAKPKALNREDFETKPPKETKPFVRGPGNPKKFDGKPDGQKNFRPDGARQNQNPANKPPRHDGFDRHSGAKTSNKPPAKKNGAGAGNWGDEANIPTGGWPEDVVTTPSATGSTGWGDEGEKKDKVATTVDAGWGDEDEKKPDKTETTAEEKIVDQRDRKPAWDEEEGHGKILLDEFQKTVAAERAQKLVDLKVGVKPTGRTVEQTVDLSKCSYRETTDEKEKRFAEERKKQLAEEKKRRGQQRAGETNVDLSTIIQVRSGRGGRGGGRGGDRPPRTEGGSGDQSPASERPAGRGGRGGRGGGGGGSNRVPKNAFPDLAPAPVKAATPPAAASPKSTK